MDYHYNTTLEQALQMPDLQATIASTDTIIVKGFEPHRHGLKPDDLPNLKWEWRGKTLLAVRKKQIPEHGWEAIGLIRTYSGHP